MKEIYLAPIDISMWGDDTLFPYTQAFYTQQAAFEYAKKLYPDIPEEDIENSIVIMSLVEE